MAGYSGKGMAIVAGGNKSVVSDLHEAQARSQTPSTSITIDVGAPGVPEEIGEASAQRGAKAATAKVVREVCAEHGFPQEA